jgi:hypothetical protein
MAKKAAYGSFGSSTKKRTKKPVCQAGKSTPCGFTCMSMGADGKPKNCPSTDKGAHVDAAVRALDQASKGKSALEGKLDGKKPQPAPKPEPPKQPDAPLHTQVIAIGKKLTVEMDAALKPHQEKIAALTDLFNKLDQAFDNQILTNGDRVFEVRDAWHKTKAAYHQAVAEYEKVAESEMSKIRAKLMGGDGPDPKVKIGASGVGFGGQRQQADQVAALQIGDKTAAIMSEKDIRSTVGEFARMTKGGAIGKLKQIDYAGDRAYANEEKGFINIGKHSSQEKAKAVLFHEMAHLYEGENPDLQKAAADWVKSRATGPETQLAKLLPHVGYGPNEKAYPDKFIRPYIGKLYPSGATEVFAMGLERFSDSKAMAKFYQGDPEHFHLMLGALNR